MILKERPELSKVYSSKYLLANTVLKISNFVHLTTKIGVHPALQILLDEKRNKPPIL